MNVYCDLVINSKALATLPDGLFLDGAQPHIEFTDNESAARQRQRERRRSAGIPVHPELARYWWEISSRDYVVSDDLHAHLTWILGHLHSGRLLSDLNATGYSYYFSVFWGESNGTGGGPLLGIDVAELLVRHRAKMAIGFYVK